MLASNVPGMAALMVVSGGTTNGAHFRGYSLPENMHLLDAPVRNKAGVQMRGLVPK